MTDEFSRASYADPNGRLLASETAGAPLRRIVHAPFRRTVARVLADPRVQGLLADGALVATRVAEGPESEPSVLEHDALWPVTYPWEWIPEMLADAGLHVLRVCRSLLPGGLTLADGTPRNVLWDGVRPVFVDFTSIVELGPLPEWSALAQYLREVINPLLLCEQGLDGAWRYHAMTQPRLGVLHSKVARHLGLRSWLRRPISSAVLARMAAMEHRPPRPVGKVTPEVVPNPARRLTQLDFVFRHLERRTAHLRESTERGSSGGWTAYYESDVDQETLAAKLEAVRRVLAHHRPRRVLDLGANTGRFSFLAAEQGARVVAVDTDAACLRAMYNEAQHRRLPLTPLLMDAACPTPAGGLGCVELPGAAERLSADVTLALGISHHLALRLDYPLDRLVDALAAYRSPVLLLEFVGPGDPRAAALGAGLRPWYDLDVCRAALGRYFNCVEGVPLSGHRELLVGSARKDA